jgi:hypothetical protein
MNWIKVPNFQFIRILKKCPNRDSNQGAIGYTTFYATFFSLGEFLMQMKLLEITNVDFDVIGQ